MVEQKIAEVRKTWAKDKKRLNKNENPKEKQKKLAIYTTKLLKKQNRLISKIFCNEKAKILSL